MADEFFTIVSDADAVSTAWERRIDTLHDRLNKQRLTWDSKAGEIDVTEWAADLLEAIRTDQDGPSLREIGWAMYWSHDMPLMLAMYDFIQESVGDDAAALLDRAWTDLCGWKNRT